MLTNQFIELFIKLKLPLNQIYDKDGKLTILATLALIFFLTSLASAYGKIYKKEI